MPNFEKEMKELKTRLATSEDFSDIYQYFLDNLGENLAFLDIGEKVDHPVVEAALQMIGKQVLDKDGAVKNLTLVHVPEYGFYHGPCFIGNKMASVMFFEDINMGIVSILMGFDTSEVRFARFTGIPVENVDESKGPLFTGRSSEIH